MWGGSGGVGRNIDEQNSSPSKSNHPLFSFLLLSISTDFLALFLRPLGYKRQYKRVRKKQKLGGGPLR